MQSEIGTKPVVAAGRAPLASRRGRLAVAAAIALTAAGLAAAGLPSPVYEARAVIGVEDDVAPERPAMTQAATDAIASRAVLSRAAASLIGTTVAAPQPTLLERTGVALGLGSGASSREDRLARVLAGAVRAVPDATTGAVTVTATDADADRAALIASAVAEALVADQNDRLAAARALDEGAAAARRQSLRTAAETARRRLAALGVADDPVAARSSAAARTEAARARLEAIRAIVASGTPPFSDRKDVPPSIDAAQNAYLDLTRQLAKARETLGERHMTVIALQEAIKRAAANLTAEWKRLARLAEADLADARAREAALGRDVAPADAKRRAAVDEARLAARAANEALARDEAARAPRVDGLYRLVAKAPVPGAPTGLASMWRWLAALVVGAAAGGLALLLPTWLQPARRGRRGEVTPSAAVATPPARHAAEDRGHQHYFDTEPEPEMRAHPDETMDRASRHGSSTNDDEASLIEAMAELLPEIEAIAPQWDIPVVMVAGNEVAAGTNAVALALGRSATEAGLRVLLVEHARPRPELAAAADLVSEPVLVDVFGSLRVALRAEGDDALYLAPTFRDGTRIASALARNGETPFVDDLAGAFDLVVIDGGRAADAAGFEAVPDAYLRVGRFASQRDDERFLSTFATTRDAFLGTIVASAFVPKAVETPKVVARPPVAPIRVAPAPLAARARPSAPAPAPRRTAPTAMRRRVGLR